MDPVGESAALIDRPLVDLFVQLKEMRRGTDTVEGLQDGGVRCAGESFGDVKQTYVAGIVILEQCGPEVQCLCAGGVAFACSRLLWR